MADIPGLVVRNELANGILALYQAQENIGGLAPGSDYATGYLIGYQDALLAVAQLTGLRDETIKLFKNKINPRSD